MPLTLTPSIFSYIFHYNISGTFFILGGKKLTLWFFPRLIYELSSKMEVTCLPPPQVRAPKMMRKALEFSCSQWKSNTFEWDLSWHSRMSKWLSFHRERLVALVSASEVKKAEWGCRAWERGNRSLSLPWTPSQHIQPQARLFLPCYMVLN